MANCEPSPMKVEQENACNDYDGVKDRAEPVLKFSETIYGAIIDTRCTVDNENDSGNYP